MSTGIASWSNPAEITAIYPFVGTEVLLVVAGFAFWIWWHVKQIRDESRELEKQAAYFREIGLDRAMHYGAEPRIATTEEHQGTVARANVEPKDPKDPPPEQPA